MSKLTVPLLDLPYSASIRSIKLNSTLRINTNKNLNPKLVDDFEGIQSLCAPEGPYEKIEAAVEA